MSNIFTRLIKYSIYVLVFLLPLFFLPFSFEILEFNKQYLLVFLVSLALFSWVAKMVLVDKEVRIKRSPLDIFVLGFLFLAILSAIFSVDKTSSLFGFYGRFANSLIGLLSLGILYFLITNHVELKDDPKYQGLRVQSLTKLFFWSGLLVVFITYLSLFGVWFKIANIFSLPGVMVQQIFNTTSGSLQGLAIFLAVFVAYLVGRMITEGPKGKSKTVFSWLVLLAPLFLMVIIDFTTAWFVLLLTLAALVVFSLWRRIFRENVNRLLIPIFLIVIALLFIPSQPQKIIFGDQSLLANLPREQVLSQANSWQIGLKSALDNIKSGFLGSGLGTFHYDFAKEKPLTINQTWLWQIRFDRPGSHLAEILGTMGFLGLIAYLTMVGLFLMVSWFFVTEKVKTKSESLSIVVYQLPLLIIFIALLIGQFLYYQNLTLAFIFWLALGLSVVSWQKPIREKTVTFKEFPELALVFATIIIILGISLLAVYFYGIKFYLADINYGKSQRMNFSTERTQFLENAVRLNPGLAQYRVALGRAYLVDVLSELEKPSAEQDTAKVQNLVAQAINEARIASLLAPNLVFVQETLGMIYREIRSVATGATEWGIKSFEKAIELEPVNPVLYTELGKLHLVANNQEKAKESFAKAIEKKADYIDALIQQVLILEREGDLLGTIVKMEGLVQAYPFNTEVSFQLGRLYFNNNQISAAIEQFKRVIILSPGHSNAHYSLAVAYAAKGQRDLAIEEFEKVLELNPDNRDVLKKLKDLGAR